LTSQQGHPLIQGGNKVIRRVAPAFALAAGTILLVASTGFAAVTLTRISSDKFTNATAVDGVNVYHKSQLEPDTFSFGTTIVATFQSGRFYNGGSSDIGWATSQDAGVTWKHGFLPGTTFQVDPTSPYERVSDPSVAYDAKHKVWMISSIPLTTGLVVPLVFISRSTDGGLSWKKPRTIPPPSGAVSLDKNWTACDNTPTSPHYGNCYTEFDNVDASDLELISTSSDGGRTWRAPISTPQQARGLGGQPVVQPNGNLVVPFESLAGTIAAFGSTDGGAHLTNAVTIAHINFHSVAGSLRTSPLPTAEIDGLGKVYVAWEDCVFESGCPANDIVFSSSSNGLTWSAPSRVPIDAIGSGVDHFIPGLAVDPSTSGTTAHLGLTFYYYPAANCTVSTCQLDAGFISSSDSGTTWGGKVQLAGPMKLTWLALSSQGYMVGDYISTSFIGGLAFPAIAVASSGTATQNLRESMYSTSAGLTVARGGIPSDQEAADGVSAHPWFVSVALD
jgi:hypothetical protein